MTLAKELRAAHEERLRNEEREVAEHLDAERARLAEQLPRVVEELRSACDTHRRIEVDCRSRQAMLAALKEWSGREGFSAWESVCARNNAVAVMLYW